jgi:hypothetical protein
MSTIAAGEAWPVRAEREDESYQPPYELVAVNGLSAVIRDEHQRLKELNTYNEYGIVQPPPISTCLEDCAFKGEADECELTQHHLHSTKPEYKSDSKLAEKFRETSALTVWLHECAHREHHNRFMIHIPIPHPKVMKQGKYEGRKLKELVTNYRNINNTAYQLENGCLSLKAERNLVKSLDKYRNRSDSLLESVMDLKVLPEELITGALLLVAPEFARPRLEKGGGFALTGVIDKKEAPLVLNNAQEILLQAA